MPKDLPSIACMHCGYALEGISSSRCPECGAPFDRSDPSTFRRLLPDPVRLCGTSVEGAQRLRAELADHGIDVVIEESIGVFQPGDATLWVGRHDLAQATALVRSASSVSSQEPWTCPHCQEQIPGQFAVCWSCGCDRSGGQVLDRPEQRSPVPGPQSRGSRSWRQRLLVHLVFALLIVAFVEFWTFPGHVPMALLGAALVLSAAILSSILRHLPSRQAPDDTQPPSGASRGT